jgi:heat shock protein HtpX
VERSAIGRDLGLAVRISLALGLMTLLYLGGEALFLTAAVKIVLDGAYTGAVIALLFAVGIAVALIAQVFKSATLALRATQAAILAPHQEPDLQALVARVAAMADLPAPRVARIPSPQANALAVGISPRRAVLAVTTGLLSILDYREKEAVVAHEVVHIANRDGPVMTFMSGPALLGSLFWREGEHAGRLLHLVLYWPIHVLSLLLTWAISRYREYVADRGAVLLTGSPEALMSALIKISTHEPQGDLRGGAAVSALCIVSSRRETGRLAFLRRLEIFLDHPPLEKRLARLADIAQEMGRPVV